MAGFVHAAVDDARVQVSDAPGTRFPGAAFVGGFVPDDPGRDPALRQCRDRRPVDAFVEDAGYDLELRGTYLYGGLIYGHFGHAMCEMVHRILPARNHFAERPWLFVGLPRGEPLLPYATLPDPFRQALDFLGVAPENVLCLHRNARVSRLLIAEQGSDFGGGPKPGYLELLRAHSCAVLDRLHPDGSPSRRVVVSRRNMPPGGGFLGSAYLEAALEREGFLVFCPEDHPLSWQMEVYRRAELLVFPEGSACHGTELLGAGMLGRTVLLERRPSHRRVFENLLGPRAAELHVLSDARTVGSLVSDPVTGAPNETLGVVMFEPERLVSAFRAWGIAALPDFRAEAYVEACLVELRAYVDAMTADGDDPDRARALFDAVGRIARAG